MGQDDGHVFANDVQQYPQEKQQRHGSGSDRGTAPGSPPPVVFDGRWLRDPAMPQALQGMRLDGIRKHLWRYGNQVAARNAIVRLEDPDWLAAWDAALAELTDCRVVLHGSELGVFALRALHHGAAHVLCAEPYPLEARIATGIVQKHFMKQWRAQFGEVIASWTEQEQRASFEFFAACVDIVNGEPQTVPEADCLVFSQIDHTLLGTGIVQAVRRHQGEGRTIRRVLPASARVFAMAIAWNYDATGYQLEALNALRWSPYPQPLDVDTTALTPMSEPIEVGSLDFSDFQPATWDTRLPIVKTGDVDAIVFWFELNLGGHRIGNEPGSPLRWLKPAVQHIDAMSVTDGDERVLRTQVTETRFHFQLGDSASSHRSQGLPGWYVSTLGDTPRMQAYRAAISRALDETPDSLVLDISAGCGILPMVAAEAGAQQIVGCESNVGIMQAGRDIIAANGYADRVSLISKDRRNMTIPEELPRPADLVVVELFDCSLIGEGVLHYLAHAREHLLAESARYVPAKARIRAMLIEYRLDRLWDLDVNLLNPYRAHTGFINVDAARLDYRPLSEPFDVFEFDFATASPQPEDTVVRLSAIASGTVGAVLFWFDLGLDDANWLSNDPHVAGGSHWKQGLQVLPELSIETAGELPLRVSHNGSRLSFRWEAESLAKEDFSMLPRWDPRWLAANTELEQQTQALLQHCVQNPDEYAKVAEIALRIAVDPAAHGIEPGIAQRFASLFFNT